MQLLLCGFPKKVCHISKSSAKITNAITGSVAPYKLISCTTNAVN